MQHHRPAARARAISHVSCLALLAAMSCAGAAQAQAPAAPAESDALEEVVVTAERRTSNVQSTPIAVTALSGEALADKNVTRLDQLQYAAPSLTVTDAGLTQSVNIRGIGLASASPQVSNGVATYIDGLFQPPVVSTTSFYDVGNVEVLRGPQGTFVGSNSTGGAIFITSRNPQLNGFGGYAEAGVANYAGRTAQGAVNLPVTDTFALRLAANFRKRNSFFDDRGVFDNDAGALNEKNARLGVLWQPGHFRALGKVEWAQKRTGGYAYQPIPTTRYAPFGSSDGRTLLYDAPTANNERALMSSLELRYEFDNGITIRSLSGAQNKRIRNLFDMDATSAAPAITRNQFVRERQWSQEVNIISPTDGVFDWIVGAYWQKNKIDVAILDRNAGFPTDISIFTNKETTGYFAQAGYDLTQTLKLDVGLRYSSFKAKGIGGGVFIGRGVPGFPALGNRVGSTDGRHSDDGTTGKISLNWQANPDNLLYVFVAKGYKPGGFDSPTTEFDPETVTDYEAGWKSTLLDGRLRTQVGVFYNKYKNFQFDVLKPQTGRAGVVNVSDATVKGFEASLQGRFGAFGFDGGLSYVDSQLSNVAIVNGRILPPGTLGPQCAAGVPSSPPACFNYTPFIQQNSGGKNLFSPAWTYNVGVHYDFELANGITLTPRLNYAYVGPQWTNLLYSRTTDYLEARRLLSGQLTLSSGVWSAELYATNLTDEDYVSGQAGNNQFYGAPREYGVRLNYSF